MSNQNLSYFMNLPYKIEIVPERDCAGYNVAIPALKGCMAFGETLDEALETLGDVKQSWLELAIEREWTIPEPTTEEKEYSGRFNVRLPRYLHRELAEIAEAEETSLNQLVVALLSDGVGRRSYAGRRTRSRTVKPFPQAEWASLCSWILKPLDRQKRVRETTPNALYWQMVDALQLASEPE